MSVAVWLTVLLCAAGIASAQDAVKLSGFWIEPVTVRGIVDGQVQYLTQAGLSLSRPFSSLEGLRLRRYPALGRAQDAADQGDDKSAATLFGQVVEQAKEPWVKAYARMQRVKVLARLGEAETALGEYVDMVVSGADLVFVAEPPVDAVASADAAVRLRVAPLAKAGMETVAPERATLLQRLIDAAGSPPPDVASTATVQPSNEQNARLPLSASAPAGSIVNLYRAGQYDRALNAANEALTQPGRTAAELYLKGMAQLALAEQTKDQDAYKSAGLSFMRVVTYFPRSAVAGPAWLEAGYVHQLIGRGDIAARLYERARPLIHPEEDPAYYQRLSRLSAELEPTR
jgi:tetratricopeptide (TPR) repeat protein